MSHKVVDWLQTESRCVVPRARELTWLDYPKDASALFHIKTWLAGLPDAVRDEAAGQIIAKRRLGARGQLAPYDKATRAGDIRHVATKPFLWELRWTLEGKELRQYHGEPIALPNLLIATHFHVKEIHNSKTETFDAQQQHIAEAYERFSSGERNRWVEIAEIADQI